MCALPVATATLPTTTTNMSGTNRRRGGVVDWNTFYKNGYPKEVIVIDDDSPAPLPPAQCTRSKRKRIQQENPAVVPKKRAQGK